MRIRAVTSTQRRALSTLKSVTTATSTASNASRCAAVLLATRSVSALALRTAPAMTPAVGSGGGGGGVGLATIFGTANATIEIPGALGDDDGG
jgi:hypothetical protein